MFAVVARDSATKSCFFSVDMSMVEPFDNRMKIDSVMV